MNGYKNITIIVPYVGVMVNNFRLYRRKEYKEMLLLKHKFIYMVYKFLYE